ncbi:uncharacterized protein DUF3365 [Mariniflexile fucanivorans]|uniref:Uncharacterized protein DUF3365 n=1 Tax=Mariniflexile fucanivorans TaxID=264023 RepID=A0A4R1RMV1_9FLAO|nr:DUF3365 domain-containing protein [Mariniflexile fucanivorans]TCL67621.1 uncharacterized protein DUF3365 [Mariniflexile fucanivorans]
MIKNIITIVFISLVFSCNNSKKGNYISKDKEENTPLHPGKKLMETNCYVCHNPAASEEDRIAPAMVAVKNHYIDSNTSKEEFIAKMQAWIKNPNKDDAKMVGSVDRFGVMPKTPYPEKTIEQIADYMFDNDIEGSKDFEKHFNEEIGTGNAQGKEMGQEKSQTNFQNLPYAERGLKYALTTKAVLGKNLMGTIQKKGTLEALSFCNVEAYPLTDSMAVVHNATIKRATDKPRNPQNQANTEELKYIKTFKEVVGNNEEPKPIVKELDDKVQVFYPITTNTMCLQCHGKPNETIEKSTLTKIKNLYHTDKAIGYDVNEVRGIWSITFDK